MFDKISEREDRIGRRIVNAAFKVHKELGPGLLEKIYEVCLAHELKKEGLEVIRQLNLLIHYDGMVFEEDYA
jgi:GxxExxY protein